MRKSSVFIVLILFLCFSCIIPFDIFWYFEFCNDTNEEVLVIVSEAKDDSIIPIDNRTYYCPASTSRHIANNKQPWYEIITDSAYVYVISYAHSELPPNKYLSEEDIERITPEMILSRKVIYNSQLHEYFEVHYP